jgi:hypothetical protein
MLGKPESPVVKTTTLFCVAVMVVLTVLPDALCQTDPPKAKPQASSEAPKSATLPFTLDHNRMIVEVEFLLPSGILRKATAWVDTGIEEILLSESLARALELEIPDLDPEALLTEIRATAPPMRLGGLPLSVEGLPVKIFPGDRALPGIPAEANLPAAALRQSHVVFDYPARQITIAQPGVLEPKGVKLPCRINAETGLIMVTAILDGEPVALGVDNGAAGTWVSTLLTKKWRNRHPDWPHAKGAAGSTNFFGFAFELQGTLMRLPELGLGAFRVRDVALLGIDQRMWDWYSQKSAAPVLGILGPNVLREFRIEIDFPNQKSYWKQGAPAESTDQPSTTTKPNDLDIVGLTLYAGTDGSFTIAAVVTRDGKPAVEGVLAGDRLLSVNELDTTGATMGQVVESLRGKPGDNRTLLLERDGKQVSVEAVVLRLP